MIDSGALASVDAQFICLTSVLSTQLFMNVIVIVSIHSSLVSSFLYFRDITKKSQTIAAITSHSLFRSIGDIFYKFGAQKLKIASVEKLSIENPKSSKNEKEEGFVRSSLGGVSRLIKTENKMELLKQEHRTWE